MKRIMQATEDDILFIMNQRATHHFTTERVTGILGEKYRVADVARLMVKMSQRGTILRGREDNRWFYSLPPKPAEIGAIATFRRPMSRKTYTQPQPMSDLMKRIEQERAAIPTRYL